MLRGVHSDAFCFGFFCFGSSFSYFLSVYAHFLRVFFFSLHTHTSIIFSAPQIRCVEGRRYRSIVHFYLIPMAPQNPVFWFLFIAPRKEVLALLAVSHIWKARKGSGLLFSPFKGGKQRGTRKGWNCLDTKVFSPHPLNNRGIKDGSKGNIMYVEPNREKIMAIKFHPISFNLLWWFILFLFFWSV